MNAQIITQSVQKQRLWPFGHATRSSSTKLMEELNEAVRFVQSMKQEQWSYRVHDGFRASPLFQGLQALRQKIHQEAKQAKDAQWINQGLIKSSDIIAAHSKSLDGLCSKLLSFLIQHCGGHQGIIYIHKKEDDVLIPLASYAAMRSTIVGCNVDPDSGLVGESFRRSTVQIVNQVPHDYEKIASGLGSASPKSLAIVPIASHGFTTGVIELSSFAEFTALHVEFLTKVAERFGTQVLIFQTIDETKRLLDHNQAMMQALMEKEQRLEESIKALTLKEREMAIKNDELRQAQQRILEVKEEEMHLAESKLRAQEAIHQLIIKKLQTRLREVENRTLTTEAYDNTSN